MLPLSYHTLQGKQRQHRAVGVACPHVPIPACSPHQAGLNLVLASGANAGHRPSCKQATWEMEVAVKNPQDFVSSMVSQSTDKRFLLVEKDKKKKHKKPGSEPPGSHERKE